MIDPAAPDAGDPARQTGLDRLGLLVGALALLGACLPFASLRANRIVPGEGLGILSALPGWEGAPLILGLAAFVLVAASRRAGARARLASGALALALLLVSVGRAAAVLAPEAAGLARASPGAGFWVLLFAVGLGIADALVRLAPGPGARVAALALAAGLLAALLGSGSLDRLSILLEYETRADGFWREARVHCLLAFGAVLAAAILGLPLGLLCHRLPRLRSALLGVLNIVQTIPSIAFFGLMIGPLAWIAANVPGARALGVSGIGPAPAFLALVGYSLLPIVSNTVVGLAGVPAGAVDAARGMGMTRGQRLFRVELPLALPLVLTGFRIVLVQNIGIATVAALIGGGGLGVFVFQGIGQTAPDLVLLGAVPTVLLAFASAVVLDAAAEALSRGPRPIRSGP